MCVTTDWRDTFRQFAARKEHEAVVARLPPYRTTLEEPTANAIALGNAWSRRLFDGSFYLSPSPDRRRPACCLVFVQSREGNTGARDPSLLGGGETDKHLIYEGLSRVAADAVLAGAETVRGSRLMFSIWHPELVRLRESLGRPRHPIQIVATLVGLDLDRQLLFNVPELPVLLITVGACARLMETGLTARPWITPIVMERPDELPKAFERLHALGIERVSCVGGRTLATQLIDAGLVQDVYLTTSPYPGGEPATPMYTRPLDARVVVRKRGTGVESGVMFEHLDIF